MRVTWRPRADQQRSEAIDYIAEQDPITAVAVLDRIEEQTDMLMQQPKMGRPGRVKGTRELVISRTPFVLVCHQPDATGIEILQLLHGSQQWPPVKR